MVDPQELTLEVVLELIPDHQLTVGISPQHVRVTWTGHSAQESMNIPVIIPISKRLQELH